MNVITGEKIQFECGHFVGTNKDFKFNHNVGKYNDRFIYIGDNKEIDNKSTIFCYTHLLNNSDALINTLKMLKNPFKLFFHNSDGNFDKNHLILFDKLPLLKCVYTQNMNVICDNVYPLPIGFANSMWKHGDASIYKEIIEMRVDKTKDIYFNFNIATSSAKRTKCFNEISALGVKWNNNLSYKEYLIELKRHKFAICPEGNGIDTHRFWECLYMNVIPICKKNILTQHYSKIFPIILLDEWKDLDIKILKPTDINQDLIDMKNIFPN